MKDSRRNVRYMPNGNKPPAALRLSEAAPLEPPAVETPMMEEGAVGAGAGAGGFELTGDAHRAFKDMLGHECKVGDKYTIEVTATDVTPNSIAFSLDNVESEYEEPPVAAAEESPVGPAGKTRTPAMTYA
jgi:hypothetical protein